MIYITQLIYIKEGKEETFHQFESVAIPIIYKYNGKLELRTRPSVNSKIEGELDPPYEIHLVSFGSETDFHNFMQDEERKQFVHLKEESISTILLYKGQKI